jgi:chemotaxis signal transduction protein
MAQVELAQAAELREQFDRGFALPAAAATEVLEDFLAIRVGAVRYAFRLLELGGLFRERTIVAVNARAPALLGVAGFRGKLAPIHDLGQLLGQASQVTPRWIVLARGPTPVGFAFEGFEAHLRLPTGQVVASDGADAANVRPAGVDPHVCGLLKTSDAVRPLIHVASLLAAIGKGER